VNENTRTELEALAASMEPQLEDPVTLTEIAKILKKAPKIEGLMEMAKNNEFKTARVPTEHGRLAWAVSKEDAKKLIQQYFKDRT